MRSLIQLFVIAFVAAALTGCGEQTTPLPTSTAPKASPAMLTAEELAALFLKDAQVWKFSSAPGIAAKSVRLQLIEDGKNTFSSTSHLSEGEKASTVIVVAQQLDKQHVLKFYVKRTGGSSVSTSEAWFNKPLHVSGATTHTAPAPIEIGTVTLMSGSSELPEAGKTYSSENDPSRLELVIE